MRIVKYLNCTQQEIEEKKYNIFLWISLWNKYFSKENLEKYISWALKYSNWKIVILIADIIHSINYEVFDWYNKERALKIALRKWDEKVSEILDIISNLPLKQQNLVKIIRWEDLMNQKNYSDSIIVIKDFYENNINFRETIYSIIKEHLWDRVNRVKNISDFDKLAQYVLYELPFLLNWFEYEWLIFNLHPYPWLSSLDDLFFWIRNKNIFPELAEKLDIKNHVAEIEAYVY